MQLVVGERDDWWCGVTCLQLAQLVCGARNGEITSVYFILALAPL